MSGELGWLLVAIAILAVGAIVMYRNRRPQIATPVDAAALERGEIPDSYHQALADMEQRVGAAVSKFYRAQRALSPYWLAPDAEDYAYTEKWGDLVTSVQIVDSLPNGALGEMMRSAPGSPRVLVLVRSHLQDVGHLQHELLHSLTWNHQELWSQCVQYPGDHWPVIFQNLIGD